MNRLIRAVLVAGAIGLALSGLQAASASATCRRVKGMEPSNYNSRNGFGYCGGSGAGTGGYSKISSGTGTKIGPTSWCYRVQSASDVSKFATSACSGAEQAMGGWFTSEESPPAFYTLWSKLGTIKALNKGNHTFTLANEKKVVCEKAEDTGMDLEEEEESIALTVTYSKCLAFSLEATISKHEEGWFASGYLAYVGSKTTINVPGASCSVVFGEAPVKNAELKTVEYSNLEGGKIQATAKVLGVEYEVTGEGTECGKSKSSGMATFEGSTEIELEGGTVKFE